ncbi:glycosyl transferase family 2 [Mangrovimonas yunxiaonensis]|uniref:Glycosyl transferase family 2 n=1 Tax=Mangrovimonas yunxiaonensis TaxID=1197477 RepID=A0A084TIZ9_9FLAO|nr:glycosyltransferase family 2 protein [Mangrovimonas yunxiaonensis]KFB00685.1 glycosyl transferase family 2 [Mangrovimonas yunxiaonensis]
MKLSVVILNYNVRHFLELCLASVHAAVKDLDAEIIVVDNNSPDDSCQLVKTSFPEVVLIENNTNAGFSKGNNLGVAQAKGEYVCILNPDTVVAEDTFKTLLAFAQNQQNLGIVGCRLVDGTGAFLPESKRNVPTPAVALKKMMGFPKQYYANHVQQEQVAEVAILVGAFMLMKTSVYREVGGFDEDYFMYGEDVDLSYKVLKAGYANFYNGTTTIIHFKGESTLKDVNYARRFYGAMQIFYQKHFKTHALFNALVWVGIKLAFLFRKQPKQTKTNRRKYVFYTTENKRLKTLRDGLKRDVEVVQQLDQIAPQTEIIFDANTVTYRAMIEKMKGLSDKRMFSFKIFPKNATFILGSNSSKNQGEVINLLRK